MLGWGTWVKCGKAKQANRPCHEGQISNNRTLSARVAFKFKNLVVKGHILVEADLGVQVFYENKERETNANAKVVLKWNRPKTHSTEGYVLLSLERMSSCLMMNGSAPLRTQCWVATCEVSTSDGDWEDKLSGLCVRVCVCVCVCVCDGWSMLLVLFDCPVGPTSSHHLSHPSCTLKLHCLP